jgi:hypothetical protein
VAEIIERYLDDKNLDRLAKDFKFLVKTVRNSYGELDLMFRKGRFTIYHRGNNLATVLFRPDGRYYVDIHEKFFRGAGLHRKASHSQAANSSYVRVECDATGAHTLLQKGNVAQLMKAIRDVNAGEEITFEQILMADNPPAPGFFIIDRQVQDKNMQERLDLLGLRRLEDGRYGFVVIEVKLGKNGELTEQVAHQLDGYIRHIEHEGDAYARCYTKTYSQKRHLGLMGDDMPSEIAIDVSHVEGLVVVGGYTQLADEQARRLRDKHPDLKVRIFRNRLYGEDGTLVG